MSKRKRERLARYTSEAIEENSCEGIHFFPHALEDSRYCYTVLNGMPRCFPTLEAAIAGRDEYVAGLAA